jgi:rubrerythrin
MRIAITGGTGFVGRHLAREALIRILRHAYSGERAAALAYREHWRSLPEGPDRRRIHEIEEEEWRHRKCVGGMLDALGARPSAWSEARAAMIGAVLGGLCHVAGRLAPMYGAGRLESVNIREYEAAAVLAVEAGLHEHVESFLEMAEVEWEHERYFRSCVTSHRWAWWIPLWTAPPPKGEIRRSFRLRAGDQGLSRRTLETLARRARRHEVA